MAYYSDTILFTTELAARYTIVRASSVRAYIQCYVGGVLLDNQIADGDGAEFHIERLKLGQYIHLLGVDADDAETDYFSQAFPIDYTAGNRIQSKSPTQPGYLPNELWRVYLDTAEVHEQLIWPRPDSPSTRIGGRGTLRGFARGVEAYGSGKGNWRGLQRGYEPVSLIYDTEVLSPGTYRMDVTTVDAVGNESAVTSDLTFEHDTYPAENSDLAVTGYTKATDALVLSFTESEDV